MCVSVLLPLLLHVVLRLLFLQVAFMHVVQVLRVLLHDLRVLRGSDGLEARVLHALNALESDATSCQSSCDTHTL
jgi:hypothetical protein